LFFQDRGTAFIALGFGAFMLALWLVTRRLVPEPRAGREVLKAEGSRALLTARALVVAASVIVVFIHSFAGSRLVLMPGFESAYRAVARLAPSLGSGLPNFVLYALIPGLLVAALGARRRELGLTRPARGTYLATLSVVGLFLLSWVWRMTHGGPSIPMLGPFLAHNFLSNGFSEEFQTRGLVLSHMRAFVGTEWALLTQAVVFALLHFGGSLHDEPGVIGVLANVLALNLPMGYFLGRAALRTGSLFLPTVVHVALDTTRNVWM
jgi:membrane protease YdiL (CAAX protease family)